MLCIFRSECVLPWCPVAHCPPVLCLRMMSPGDLPSQVQPPAEKCTRSRVQRTAEHSVERRDTQVSLQKHSLLGEKQTVSLFVQNWWKKTEERFLCLAQSVPIVMISTLVWWSWLMEPNIKMTKRFLLCVHTLFCYILFPWADVDLLGCNIPYRRPKVFIGLPCSLGEKQNF